MTGKIPDFSIVPTEILSDKQMTFRMLKVYMAIKAFMNKDTHDCFPSRHLIAEMTDIPVTRISVETERLEQLGWIKKTGVGGRSMPCVYTVFSTKQPCSQKDEETVTEMDTVINSETVTKMITVTESETVTDFDKTVTELSGNGYRIGVKTVTESVTRKEQTNEQTKNRPKEQTSVAPAPEVPVPSPSLTLEPSPKTKKEIRSQKAKDFDLEKIELPEWMPKEDWDRYVLHRRIIKKPMSIYSAESLIKELGAAKENGWTPEEIMNSAISSGYQGCVFDKHKLPKPVIQHFNQPITKSGGNNGTRKYTVADDNDREIRLAANLAQQKAARTSETERSQRPYSDF